MTPHQRKVLDLWRETGSKAEVSRRLNLDEAAVRRAIKRALKHETEEGGRPEGVKAAIETTGTQGRARYGWRVVPREDGGRDSVFWDERGGEADPADLIQAALDDLKAEAPATFPPRPPPTGVNLLEIDLADVHVGKLCVEDESGYRYDRSVAVHRMKEGARALLERAKPSGIGHILLVLGNDVLHVDNGKGTTTNGTHQDTDGTVTQMYSDALAAYVAVVEACAEVAPVDLLYVPSNHDRLLGWMLAQQVATWFRLDPRVRATPYNMSRRPRKYFRFDRNLIGETHGDGAKEADLPHLMTTEARPHISECPHRYFRVRHLHHKIRNAHGVNSQKREKDHIGMTLIRSGIPTVEGDDVQIEYVRSPSPPDDWHALHGFINRQAVECFMHHPQNGQFARFTEWV